MEKVPIEGPRGAQKGSHDALDRWISVVSRVSIESPAFVTKSNKSMDFGRGKA